MSFSVPSKARVQHLPKHLPYTSHRAYVEHLIIHAESLQHALRYFQSLEVLQALWIYGHIQAKRESYGDLEIYQESPYTYESLQEFFAEYLAWCLGEGGGWRTCPI